MKYILFALLTLTGVEASAQSNVQVVHEVAQSTNSITQTISVCNTAIDVAATTSSGTLAGAFSIEVYNVGASTQIVNCGFDPSLSATVTNAWYGREVPPGVGMVWQKLTNRILYCINAIAGCSRVTITQMK